VRRRLLVVLLSTVVIALTVASLGSFLLLRADDSAREIQRLRDSSERLAGNIDAPNSLDIALSALNLTAAAQVRFPVTSPTLDQVRYIQEKGLPVQSLIEVTEDWTAADFAEVAKGRTVSRVNKGLTWAMAPVGPATTDRIATSATDQPAPEPLPEQNLFEAIVLVGPVTDTATRAVGLIALGSLAGLAITALAASVIAQNISAPLRAATGAYRRIASGDLTVRVRPTEGRTRRKNDEVQELLVALDSMSESLQRARDQERQFLLSVSHDLRTPLTSIRGYAEALADGAVTDPERSAAVIVAESRRLERLVKDLLDLAKLESNQFTLKPANVDVTDLVTDVADGFLPAAEDAGVTLELVAPVQLRANIDPDRLAQMVANLIENAMKFARTKVVVGIKADGQPPTQAQRFRITVTDDGPGIDPDDLPHVFERSFTSDRQPTRKIGSGLGLAIVSELAVAMGATVDIDTSPAGTTFSIVSGEAVLS
jgi:signal transduction histidine kinase